ncbi:hypothetical protein [Vogesella oryzae]|uniref:hypothetical protein n=1 Tax=Vogesella oryzae TaxID=1735285 RepID=UPI001583246B|nr:hypothetical protein [Vogesella oryzae]
MKLTLIIPGLSWLDAHDGREVSKNLPLPALATLLGRGQLHQQAGSASKLLQHTFALTDLALAAELAAASGLETAGRRWLVADPVNLRVDRDRALLGDIGIMNLSQPEADALVASLNQLFAEDGFVFHAPSPQRWFLSLPAASDAEFSPLPDVIGNDIDEHLPRGNKGMLWSRYLNELQMLLYTHPVNDAREARGELPVNSVWLWGEQGDEALRPTLPHDSLFAADALWQLLAQRAGKPADLAPFAFAGLEAAGDVLVQLDTLEAAAQFRDAWGWREGLQQLERDWFAPLLAALRQRRLQQLTIRCHGEAGFTLTLRPSDLWRFWKRPHALGDLYPL